MNERLKIKDKKSVMSYKLSVIREQGDVRGNWRMIE